MSAIERLRALQHSVDAVYDAHGTPAERRIPIVGHEFTALARARIVADFHAYHDGDYALGSCDAELFALEWAIFLAGLPEPKVGWRDYVRAALARLAGSEVGA